MFLYTPTDAQCRFYWAVLAIVFSLALLLGTEQKAGAQTYYTAPGYRAPGAGNRPQWRNGLPPTMLDSFVHEAYEMREYIYGDEGVTGPPPYDEYTEAHRINAGILDTERQDPDGTLIANHRASGLTTGHGSLMPDGVGRDEFLGQEWSVSSSTDFPVDQYRREIYKNPESSGTDYEFPLGKPGTWKTHYNPLKDNAPGAKENVPQYDLGVRYVPGRGRNHERDHG